MGADFIDYIVVDRFVVPPDQQPFFSERLVHLPDCYQCNDDTREIADAPHRAPNAVCRKRALSSAASITATRSRRPFLTSGCGCCTRCRGACCGCTGRWRNPCGQGQSRARSCGARGDAASALCSPRACPLPEHLARHRLADLFLDTLPYNAHTTASDALWAGLPVLTCAGNTFAGRVAGSLLRAIGLGELITTSLEEYEAMALGLARDGDLLAALRARLVRNRLTCPLFDTERFARNIESAYRQMWDTWRAGRPFAPFAVLPPADVF